MGGSAISLCMEHERSVCSPQYIVGNACRAPGPDRRYRPRDYWRVFVFVEHREGTVAHGDRV